MIFTSRKNRRSGKIALPFCLSAIIDFKYIYGKTTSQLFQTNKNIQGEKNGARIFRNCEPPNTTFVPQTSNKVAGWHKEANPWCLPCCRACPSTSRHVALPSTHLCCRPWSKSPQPTLGLGRCTQILFLALPWLSPRLVR
jgi:hypothetical protein